MVIYYSWKNHTRAYAGALAAIKNDTAFELKEQKKRSGIPGFISGGFQSAAKRELPPAAMPDLGKAGEIYVCTPIWASGITPVIRYFLKHAKLQGVTVNFLLTCANISGIDAYKKSAFDALNGTGAVPGAAYVFACPGKAEMDSGTIRRQIEKVILGVEQ